MKFRLNERYPAKLRLLILPISILILFACATVPIKSYDETVPEWKSHKDIERWMNRHFTYDMARLKEAEGKGPLLVPPRTPQETFRLKSGVCYDAAFFVKETLNRIDPSYKAKIVFIENRPYTIDHFVCSFEKDEKLFIMDYGSYRNMYGIHGPFNSLDDYKKYFERNHPKVKHVQSIRYW